MAPTGSVQKCPFPYSRPTLRILPLSLVILLVRFPIQMFNLAVLQLAETIREIKIVFTKYKF